MVLLRVLVLAVLCQTVSSLIPILPLIKLPLDPLLDCTLNLVYLPLLVCGGRRCSPSSCSNSGACRDYYDGSIFIGYTCNCPAGWYGANCHIEAVSCGHIKRINSRAVSGVYPIRQLVNGILTIIQCYCDMDTDRGGWTIIQRRVDNTQSFNKNYNDYALGFGNPARNFWFGNLYLSMWTNFRRHVLRVELKDKKNNYAYEIYDYFRVGGPLTSYKIESLGAHSGTAGDGLSDDLGMKFSAPDRDNDIDSGHCAKNLGAGWWYHDCYYANLNGVYGSDTVYGIVWYDWRGFKYSLPWVQMAIREYDY